MSLSLRRVLVVDDHALWADQLQRSLRRRGIDCDLAADGQQAIEAASANSYGGVLLDLRLGDDSGLASLAALRAVAPRAKIVLLTAYASIATAVAAIKLGADDYLAKPVDLPSILHALGERSEGMPTAPEELTPLGRVEWEHIQRALTETGGNISQAARRLGVHRRSLQRKLAKRPPART